MEQPRMVEVTPQVMEDLAAALSDAYAYRLGEEDPNHPEDIEETDLEGMRRAQKLADLFGVTLYD